MFTLSLLLTKIANATLLTLCIVIENIGISEAKSIEGKDETLSPEQESKPPQNRHILLMMIKSVCLTFTIIFILVLYLGTNKHDMMKLERIAFPQEQTYSPEEQRQRYWKCKYTVGAQQLHYWLLLPNDVKPVNLVETTIEGLSMYCIGEYASVDEDKPRMEVAVCYEHCKYEMNAADWLVKKLDMMGEEVVKYKKVYGKSTGAYADVLTVKAVDGRNVISRFTVLKDYDSYLGGGNYMMVKAACFEDDYEKRALDMLQVTHNWDLMNKTDWNMAENLQLFEGKEGFSRKIKFYHPVSWKMFVNTNARDSSGNCSQLMLRHDEAEKNVGVIVIRFLPDMAFRKPDAIYSAAVEHLVNSQDFKCKLEKKDMDNFADSNIKNPKIKPMWYIQGNIECQNAKAVRFLMAYVIKDERERYYYIESIGTRPNRQTYNWEASKRCLELVVNTFNNVEFKQ